MKKQTTLISVIIFINTFIFCQDPESLLEEANIKNEIRTIRFSRFFVTIIY